MVRNVLDREKYVIGDASDHVGYMNCERISERSHIHGWSVEPHFHDGLSQLFIFDTGVVQSQIDTVHHRIEGPALVWMPAMVTHAFEYPSGMSGWVITVPSVDLIRTSVNMPWLERWTNAPQVVWGPEIRKFALASIQLAQLACRERSSPGEATNVVLESIFRLLMVNVHRSVVVLQVNRTAASDRGLTLVRRFEEMLGQHLASKKAVSDYAQMLGVTTTHLSRSVKSATGRTAGELIADRTLLEAKRKLMFTDISISEIGYALQFSSPSYFTRFFTNLTGMSPTAYRARMRSA